MRLRKSRKLVSILVTLSMLMVLLVPLATPALAAGSITALSTPILVDDDTIRQAAGTIKVTIPGGSVKNGDSVIVKLPSGFDFATPFSAAPVATRTAGVGNEIVVPAALSGGDPNGLSAANLAITILDPNDEIQITATAAQDPALDFTFYVYIDEIEVESGTNDDMTVTFDGPPASGFATGSVVAARTSTTGNVTLSVSGDDTSNNNFNFDLRVKEDTLGSLQLGNDSLRLELPDGYEWTTPAAANVVVPALWGENIIVTYRLDTSGEKLYIDFVGADANGNSAADPAEIAPATARATNIASAWDFAGILAFTVDDDTAIDPGDVVAKIKGETDANLSEAVVGTYGEFGATVSAKDAPELIAGQTEQEIGEIVIKESLNGTLVVGRTVTLTLPSGARWQGEYDATVPGGPAGGDLPDFERDEGLRLDFVDYTGTDDRTAKFQVNAVSGDAATINLEDVEVALEAEFEGDLVVTVGGTAGVSGEVTVGKVVAPITATTLSTPDVVIGLSGQAGGEFTITENIAGAFIDDATVILDLPVGVVFTSTPTVEVTEGDLRITNVRRTGNDNQVSFDISSDSDTASTIKVSDVTLKLDRTVAEGNITLKVQGAGIVETDAYPDWTNSDTAAKCAVARVATPAPSDQINTSVFTIGSTTYTLNGVEATMDVAPYIKGDRTYMPIRYVAQAAGVADSNIMWNAADQSVVLIKGDRVVKLVIGSTTLLVNGIAMTMDAAPEIVDPGRTMLPLRSVAQALGCTIEWDATTQSVTVN
ncbi:MAG: copper amine oxidase N-terminal domain-containing protein [Firmicutes bacterium]|nr:copper amine oxidase N-terminal domain-containing protein [Bacillota bacterium]